MSYLPLKSADKDMFEICGFWSSIIYAFFCLQMLIVV